MTIERMFLSVRPPAEILAQIAALPTEPRRGVRYTKRNQWHVTLRFLGNCERSDALSALDRLRAPSATVTLGPHVILLGERVVIVPAAGLDPTAAAVDDAFAAIGEPSDRPFVGHLTLARLKGHPLRNPESVSVLGSPITASWHATEVDLWKSEVTQDGATHTLVATQDLFD